MKYRLEYVMVAAESIIKDIQEFTAPDDQSAISGVSEILEGVLTETNAKIENRFYHYSLDSCKLVRIDRPEISTEIKLISNNQKKNLADDPNFMDALHDFQYGETPEQSARGFEGMMKNRHSS